MHNRWRATQDWPYQCDADQYEQHAKALTDEMAGKLHHPSASDRVAAVKTPYYPPVGGAGSSFFFGRFL